MAELQQLDSLMTLSNSCARLLKGSSIGNNNGSAGTTPIRCGIPNEVGLLILIGLNDLYKLIPFHAHKKPFNFFSRYCSLVLYISFWDLKNRNIFLFGLLGSYLSLKPLIF